MRPKNFSKPFIFESVFISTDFIEKIYASVSIKEIELDTFISLPFKTNNKLNYFNIEKINSLKMGFKASFLIFLNFDSSVNIYERFYKSFSSSLATQCL